MSDKGKDKRPAEDSDEEEKPEKPTKKKQKTEKKAAKSKKKDDTFQLNVNKAVDKKHEGKLLSEIVKLPPSALQGLSEKVDTPFAEHGIKTIADMATWKYYHMACAILDLQKCEVKGKRDDSSKLNISKAVDKKWEKASFKELAKAPLSAFKGLTETADTSFEVIFNTQSATIGALGKSKYFKWAQSLVALAPYEADLG